MSKQTFAWFLVAALIFGLWYYFFSSPASDTNVLPTDTAQQQ